MARTVGRVAMADPLDGEVLARFGKVMLSEARPLANERAQGLVTLVTSGRQLVEILTAEKYRRASAPKVLRIALMSTSMVGKRLSDFHDELAELIRKIPFRCGRDELLGSFMDRQVLPARPVARAGST